MKESLDNIKSFYDSSDLYLEISSTRRDLDFKNIIDVINEYIPKKSKLLEFGCGTGNLAHLIFKNEYKVTGVDIGKRFIEYAKEFYKEDESLIFQIVDFGKLPFTNNYFDGIYTCAVLEHCYEIEKILIDFDRLLKPGGVLIISTPNLLSPFTRLSLIFETLFGKRKRFHLYGSPLFFFKSIWYNFKKVLIKKPSPIYVTPSYTDFKESDEDVTFLSNPYDYIYMLKPLNYEIKEVSRGSSKLGKKISKIFPKLSGEVLIVATKK